MKKTQGILFSKEPRLKGLVPPISRCQICSHSSVNLGSCKKEGEDHVTKAIRGLVTHLTCLCIWCVDAGNMMYNKIDQL